MITMVQVELSSEELEVEPGGTVQVTATVTNTGDQVDRYQIEVEGVDMEWYAIPVPAVTVAPNESKRERILFRPPRSTASRAGVYPFVVRVRSLESGDAGIAQGSLSVSTFKSLEIDLTPKRGGATFFRRDTEFAVRIANRGNTEHTLLLHASDPEDACVYEFETERITLPPDGEQEVLFRVEPTTNPVIGSTQLIGFTVIARAIDDPYLSASTQGQLVHKALISGAAIVTAIVTIGVLFTFWITRPRPVEISLFTADRMEITVGDQATLSWSVENAERNQVTISASSGRKWENLPANGKLAVDPKSRTEYELVARNSLGEMPKRLTINVLQPPKPADPQILLFKADSREINKGESVRLVWKVENAEKLILSPIGLTLDPALPDYRDTPDKNIEYTLIARNAAGKVTTAKVKVTVRENSTAVIDSFDANPRTVEPGEQVTFSWQITGAVRAEINNGVGKVDYKSGTVTLSPTQTTEYVLTAADNNGRTTSQRVQIVVRKPAAPGSTPDDPAVHPPTNPVEPGT